MMESAATLVVPGLAHEEGVLAGASDDVAHCGLEEEGAVSGIQCLAVPEVDLVLCRAEFVVAGEDADVHAVEHAHEIQEFSAGVDVFTRGVDATGAAEAAAPAVLFVVVGDVELKFGAHGGGEAEGGVFGDDLLQYRAGCDLADAVVGIEGVADDEGNSGFPRHHREGVRVDLSEKVGQSRRHDVVSVEHAAAGGGYPDALTEEGRLRAVQLADEEIFGAGNAQHIRKDQAQNINPFGLQVCLECCYVESHSSSEK